MFGGTKNSNKCSVFPAAYKLDYPHTNLKINPLTQNHQNPNKIPTFQPSTIQIPLSHQISSTPTKINTFTYHITPISNHQSKPLSSYINAKIQRKSTLSPIYKLHAKFYNNISISIIIQTIHNI